MPSEKPWAQRTHHIHYRVNHEKNRKFQNCHKSRFMIMVVIRGRVRMELRRERCWESLNRAPDADSWADIAKTTSHGRPRKRRPLPTKRNSATYWLHTIALNLFSCLFYPLTRPHITNAAQHECGCEHRRMRAGAQVWRDTWRGRDRCGGSRGTAWCDLGRIGHLTGSGGLKQ